VNNPHDIIETVLVTEKSNDMLDDGKYVFKVHPSAHKIEIGMAVEKLFDVKVGAVNTINCKGKKKRMGRAKMGRRSNWKKAIVTLSEGSIDIM